MSSILSVFRLMKVVKSISTILNTANSNKTKPIAIEPIYKHNPLNNHYPYHCYLSFYYIMY